MIDPRILQQLLGAAAGGGMQPGLQQGQFGLVAPQPADMGQAINLLNAGVGRHEKAAELQRERDFEQKKLELENAKWAVQNMGAVQGAARAGAMPDALQGAIPPGMMTAQGTPVPAWGQQFYKQAGEYGEAFQMAMEGPAAGDPTKAHKIAEAILKNSAGHQYRIGEKSGEGRHYGAIQGKMKGAKSLGFLERLKGQARVAGETAGMIERGANEQYLAGQSAIEDARIAGRQRALERFKPQGVTLDHIRNAEDRVIKLYQAAGKEADLVKPGVLETEVSRVVANDLAFQTKTEDFEAGEARDFANNYLDMITGGGQ